MISGSQWADTIGNTCSTVVWKVMLMEVLKLIPSLLHKWSCWSGPGLVNVVKHSGSDANEVEGSAITVHMLVPHTHKQLLHALLGKLCGFQVWWFWWPLCRFMLLWPVPWVVNGRCSVAMCSLPDDHPAYTIFIDRLMEWLRAVVAIFSSESFLQGHSATLL